MASERLRSLCGSLGGPGLGLRSRLGLLRATGPVDAVAQLLAGAEEDPALRLDRNHFTGLGVAPVVAFVVLDVEGAEPTDLDVVAFAKRGLHAIEDRLDGA